MTSKDQEIPMETGGFGSDLAGLPGFLIDPESAAKRVHSKWFWIVPLLVCTIIAIGVGHYLTPMIVHVTAVAPLRDGETPEVHQKAVEVTEVATKYLFYLTPIFAPIFWAVMAGIMLGVAVVSGVKARFGAMFNLVAGCWVIQSLASIATAVILHFKGEPQTAAELKPPLGPDIFLGEGTNKFLMAAAGSFSVFQIWWVVMMVLVFAMAFRTSKAKGAAAVLPLWLLGMLGSLLGAFFQK